MSCCCEDPYDLGCLDACKPLDTGIVAELDGRYTLQYKFNGAQRSIKSDVITAGDNIEFNIKDLVPNYYYQARILDPEGNEVVLSYEDVPYDCLKFNIVLTLY